jgi:phage tail sheath protein FI
MPRLSYGAPGVYVEEIPSARQAIVPVGTNTVAFIGLVPDAIYHPVPYAGYDPVLARAVLTLTRSADSAQAAVDAADARAALEEQIRGLMANLAGLRADLVAKTAEEQAKATAWDEAKTAQANLPDGSDQATTRAAQVKVSRARQQHEAAVAAKGEAQSKVDQNEADTQTLKVAIAAAPAAAVPGPGAAGGGGGAPALVQQNSVETEDIDFKDSQPPKELLRPSLIRPYYLESFDVGRGAPALATKLCTNFSEYAKLFGRFSAFDTTPTNPNADPSRWNFKPLYPGHHFLTHAVKGFFDNGGTRAFVARIRNLADLDDVLERFESIDEVSIIAAPGLPRTDMVWDKLETYCEDPNHQNLFAILDSQAVVNDRTSNDFDIEQLNFNNSDNALPRMSKYAAFYFPHIEVNDPAKRLQDDDLARGVPSKYRGLTYVGPAGHMAGVYARIDEERGVHKAPANAVLRGALEVKYYISRPKQDLLNPQGVNCLRIMDGAVVVWGARTIGGDRNGEWKYVNVRRFAGFLEESIDEGTQWVVFEPNDSSLWSKIRLNVGEFLTNCWRNGALVGDTPQQAFYVKCDAELNPPEVQELGQVITEIGVAIVRPAEFVIFRISQFAGTQTA